MVPGVVEQRVPGVKKEVVPRVEKQTALPFFWLTSIASVPAFVSVHRQHARRECALTRPQPPPPWQRWRTGYIIYGSLPHYSHRLVEPSRPPWCVVQAVRCVYCGNLRAVCCVLLKINKISMLRH